MKKLYSFFGIFCLLTVNAQCYTAIDAGGYFTLAIKTNGTLWAWGENFHGELGDGTNVNRPTPIQIGTATNWKLIANGTHHSIGLRTDGTLWAWGSNSAGQLGDGTTTNRNAPVQIGTATDWKSIATKGFTSFAIKNNGTLWAWGQNNVGNVGNGTYTQYLVPTQSGTANDWKDIYAGWDTTFAIKNDNSLWGWGTNVNGQLGQGFNLGFYPNPLRVGTANDWASVSLGAYHTLALKIDGTLWAWGGNSYGELGDGTNVNKNLPVQIGTANDWRFITADFFNSYAIKTDNTLWVWGNNTYAQFGNGTTTSANFPLQSGTETNWKMITAGAYHKIAAKTDDALYYWGNTILTQNATPGNSTTRLLFLNSCLLNTTNFDENNTLLLYPNPAQNSVTIQNNSLQEISEVTMTDMTQKVVVSQKNNFDQINIEHLASGMYLVHVTLETEKRTIKLLKE